VINEVSHPEQCHRTQQHFFTLVLKDKQCHKLASPHPNPLFVHCGVFMEDIEPFSNAWQYWVVHVHA